MSDLNGFTDEELIEKSRNGNDPALDVLISRYIGLVRQHAFRLYLVGADKEDLLYFAEYLATKIFKAGRPLWRKPRGNEASRDRLCN
jgi:hypothetical protein